MARVKALKDQKSSILNVSDLVSDHDSCKQKDKNIYFDAIDIYAVERIVARRTRKRRVEYLLKWEGYSEAFNSWENKVNVTPDLIDVFENDKKSISARKVTKQRKIEPDALTTNLNGAFEVPAKSKLQDAPQKLHTDNLLMGKSEENSLKTPEIQLKKKNELAKQNVSPKKYQKGQTEGLTKREGALVDALKVQIETMKHVCDGIPNQVAMDGLQYDENEMLRAKETSTEEGHENVQIQSIKNLCHEPLAEEQNERRKEEMGEVTQFLNNMSDEEYKRDLLGFDGLLPVYA